MSLEDDIENDLHINKHETFSKISHELAERYSEAAKILETIANLEEKIDSLKEQHKRLTEEEMPEMMSELGVSAIVLPSGETIAVETSIHCGIPAHSKDQAFNWLRDNNHGDLIKNEIIVKFGRNEDNMVGDIKGLASELGLKFDEKQSVHAQTLKAFVKEQMSLGTAFPQDLFGVYIRRAVEIKLNKKLKG